MANRVSSFASRLTMQAGEQSLLYAETSYAVRGESWLNTGSAVKFTLQMSPNGALRQANKLAKFSD